MELISEYRVGGVMMQEPTVQGSDIITTAKPSLTNIIFIIIIRILVIAVNIMININIMVIAR